MKIRNGFVSNSSSSSFVLVTTKENHERTMAELSPYIRTCIEALGWESEVVFGKECVILKEWITAGDSSPWEHMSLEIPGEMDEDDAYDLMHGSLNEYEVIAKQNKKDVFTASVDL